MPADRNPDRPGRARALHTGGPSRRSVRSDQSTAPAPRAPRWQDPSATGSRSGTRGPDESRSRRSVHRLRRCGRSKTTQPRSSDGCRPRLRESFETPVRPGSSPLRPTPRMRIPILPLRLAEQAANTLRRFLHVEAVNGFALLVAAAAALIWANSTAAHSHHLFWNLPFAVGLGEHVFSRSLHFWVNDALMTVFFLVVGMEIRRELHEGALSRLGQAVLPLVAAAGGVLAPALIYLSLNNDAARGHGWTVPTATDIAFAVGVLALLGRKIPVNVRVFLLALAIIDDIIAVLIIAVFYTESLQLAGFVIAAFSGSSGSSVLGSVRHCFMWCQVCWFGSDSSSPESIQHLLERRSG
ncbi:hypothetical protein ACVW1C_005107 [Bradyrhizobium sp. USDA 4011]